MDRPRLTARFPASTPAVPLLEGVVEVAGPVSGIGPPAADAFLMQAGRVVTTPTAQDAIGVKWDLREGQTRSVPALLQLGGCAPGTYEIYARITIVPDDGPPQELNGGPYPIEISP